MTVANQKGSNSSKPAASCRYPSTGSFPWCSFFGTELHYDILTEVYPLQRSCFQFLEFTAPHNQAVIPSMLLPPLYPMSHLWLRSGHQTWLENFLCRWFSKTSMSRSCYNMLLTVTTFSHSKLHFGYFPCPMATNLYEAPVAPTDTAGTSARSQVVILLLNF